MTAEGDSGFVIKLDSETGFPLWRGEPVRRSDQWVVGPTRCTEPAQELPKAGDPLSLGNARATVKFKVLDVEGDRDKFLMLLEVVR